MDQRVNIVQGTLQLMSEQCQDADSVLEEKLSEEKLLKEKLKAKLLKEKSRVPDT